MSRPILFLAFLGLALVCGQPSTWAGTGTQSPAMTVSVTLGPAQVTAGQTATGTGSVTNNTSSSQRVAVSATFTCPDKSQANRSRTVTIKAGKTLTLSRSLFIGNNFPKGTYTLTVTAASSAGTSWASATIQIK